METPWKQRHPYVILPFYIGLKSHPYRCILDPLSRDDAVERRAAIQDTLTMLEHKIRALKGGMPTIPEEDSDQGSAPDDATEKGLSDASPHDAHLRGDEGIQTEFESPPPEAGPSHSINSAHSSATLPKALPRPPHMEGNHLPGLTSRLGSTPSSTQHHQVSIPAPNPHYQPAYSSHSSTYAQNSQYGSYSIAWNQYAFHAQAAQAAYARLLASQPHYPPMTYGALTQPTYSGPHIQPTASEARAPLVRPKTPTGSRTSFVPQHSPPTPRIDKAKRSRTATGTPPLGI